ncbi:Uncharacterised protein [Serratia liquefaciens]|nr:Uncharacterised protein [Serratia liquefaciens]
MQNQALNEYKRGLRKASHQKTVFEKRRAQVPAARIRTAIEEIISGVSSFGDNSSGCLTFAFEWWEILNP